MFFILLLTISNWSLVLCSFFQSMKVRFINFERTKLPDEILRHNLEEKRKFFSDICLEVEKNDAEVQVHAELQFSCSCLFVSDLL